MTESILAALRLLILELLSLPIGSVRPGGVNQPNEGKQFLIVTYNGAQHKGSGCSVQHTNHTMQHAEQYIEHSLTIDFFGENAAAMAATLALALRSSHATSQLDVLGLGFLSADPCKNLTALELDRMPRYQAVYFFSAVQRTAPTAFYHY